MSVTLISAWLAANWGVLLVGALVLVLGVGRLVRVVVHDEFPPAQAFRTWWQKATKNGPWALLFMCYWCAAFWFVLFALGWFALGLLVVWIGVAWWIFWGALALAYLVSMVIARDEPAE